MTIRVTTRWQSGETELDGRVVPLLRMVAREGSLNRAVAALRLSYRHAWGLLGKTERALGHSLVLMERGRGARLSPFAEQLLSADAAATSVLDRELASTLHALNHESLTRNARLTKPLLTHASHDFALGELKDLLSNSGNPIVE